jgi:hypothetical protein
VLSKCFLSKGEADVQNIITGKNKNAKSTFTIIKEKHYTNCENLKSFSEETI